MLMVYTWQGQDLSPRDGAESLPGGPVAAAIMSSWSGGMVLKATHLATMDMAAEQLFLPVDISTMTPDIPGVISQGFAESFEECKAMLRTSQNSSFKGHVGAGMWLVGMCFSLKCVLATVYPVTYGVCARSAQSD